VQTEAGYTVGSLEQAFVDKLAAETSSFLLGGRAWTVVHLNHADRLVQVSSAPKGIKPSWGGFVPQLLGFEICQQIAEVLKGKGAIPYLDAVAQTSVDAYREDLSPFLSPSRKGMNMESDKPLWWTFAGGQVNYTLKYGLQCLHDWKVVADNFRLKIEGDSVSATTLSLAIAKMREDSFWNSPATQSWILEQLPEYRLSKFQRVLPDPYAQEMVSAYLLDIPGTIRFLKKFR
jgi:ATP-dependent helicase Lhr and Lhr-like helicase